MPGRHLTALEVGLLEALAKANTSSSVLANSEAATLARVQAHSVVGPGPLFARTAALVCFFAWAGLTGALGVLSNVPGAQGWCQLLYAVCAFAGVYASSFAPLYRLSLSAEFTGADQRRRNSSQWFDHLTAISNAHDIVEFDRRVAIEMELKGIYYLMRAALMSATVACDIGACSLLLRASDNSSVTLALAWAYPVVIVAVAPVIANSWLSSAGRLFGKAQRVTDSMPMSEGIAPSVLERVTEAVVSKIAALQADQWVFLLALAVVSALEQTLLALSGGGPAFAVDRVSAFREMAAANVTRRMQFTWCAWHLAGAGALWLLRSQRRVLLELGSALAKAQKQAAASVRKHAHSMGGCTEAEVVHAEVFSMKHLAGALPDAVVRKLRSGELQGCKHRLEMLDYGSFRSGRVSSLGLLQETLVLTWLFSLYLAMSSTLEEACSQLSTCAHGRELNKRAAVAFGFICVVSLLSAPIARAVQGRIAKLEAHVEADRIGNIVFTNRLIGYVIDGVVFVCAKLLWSGILLWRQGEKGVEGLTMEGRLMAALLTSLFALFLHVLVFRNGSRKPAELMIQTHHISSRSRSDKNHPCVYCTRRFASEAKLALHVMADHALDATRRGSSPPEEATRQDAISPNRASYHGHHLEEQHGGAKLVDMVDDEIAEVELNAKIWV
jgi:hypothetical protein